MASPQAPTLTTATAASVSSATNDEANPNQVPATTDASASGLHANAGLALSYPSQGGVQPNVVQGGSHAQPAQAQPHDVAHPTFGQSATASATSATSDVANDSSATSDASSHPSTATTPPEAPAAATPPPANPAEANILLMAALAMVPGVGQVNLAIALGQLVTLMLQAMQAGGIDFQELGAQMGENGNYAAAIFNGQIQPTIGDLEVLAQVFHFPLDVLRYVFLGDF